MKKDHEWQELNLNYFMHFPLKLRRLKLNHSPTFDEILCYENIHLH